MDKPIPPSSTTQHLFEITQSSIYLMGGSFVLGSLFTVFVLLVFDHLKRDHTKEHAARGFDFDTER